MLQLGLCMGDPPFDVGEAVLDGGVVGHAHEVGEYGPGGLELDGLGGGLGGEVSDALGGGGGAVGEFSDGAVDGLAADGLDLVEDLGRARPGIGGALGDVVVPGPDDDGVAGGHGQREVGLLILVVPLGHGGAIVAPCAVLDLVRGSAGWPSRGWGIENLLK